MYRRLIIRVRAIRAGEVDATWLYTAKAKWGSRVHVQDVLSLLASKWPCPPAIRPATLRDVDALAALFIKQTRDDGFHDIFFPGKGRYPRDYRAWVRRYMRDAVLRPYSALFVAESERERDAAAELVGFVAWAFYPTSGAWGGDPDEAPQPKGLPWIAKDSCFGFFVSSACLRRTRRWTPCATGCSRTARSTPRRCSAGRAARAMAETWFVGDDAVNWFCPDLFVDARYDAAPGEDEKGASPSLRSAFVRWAVDRTQVDGVPVFMLGLANEKEFSEAEGFEVKGEFKFGDNTIVAMRHEV
ncbi:hypothetical protein GGX14DRAFT_646470 [Mycena pura]|uniref:Uncharacterized protein n=1 Tax=Mycena pura TaxID=153505 RepID=A0AAD6VBF0_9AGAR|nr:hypothetical protein GGX14DRAFT_646470 [Mycena pura]